MATSPGPGNTPEATTDGSGDLSFDEVFEIALEQAYALMDEMSGGGGAATDTSNTAATKQRSSTSSSTADSQQQKSQPPSSAASPTTGTSAKEEADDCVTPENDVTGTRTEKSSNTTSFESISDGKQLAAGSPTSSAYEEAAETIAKAGSSEADPKPETLVGDSRACDDYPSGQTNKSGAHEDDPGLTNCDTPTQVNIETKEHQMASESQRADPGQCYTRHGQTNRNIKKFARRPVVTVSATDPVSAVAMPTQEETSADFIKSAGSGDSSDPGIIDEDNLIHESVSCISLKEESCEPPRVRRRSDQVQSWEEKMPKEELIENWCKGQPLYDKRFPISDGAINQIDKEDTLINQQVSEDLISQSINDPKALLNIIEKLTGGTDENGNESNSVASSSHHTDPPIIRRPWGDRSRESQQHQPAGAPGESEEHESRKDKKRRRRFITREQAIDLPSYDAPEDEVSSSSQPSAASHRDKSKLHQLSSSTSLDNDGQGPLSPVHRQSSLQSPPTLSSNQPPYAQSQPLSSPAKPDPASLGSQDSSLDMYAIEKSATLPANFSLDSIRGGPRSQGTAKSSYPSSRALHAVDGPTTLPPSGTGHDRRNPYGPGRSYESNKTLDRSNTNDSSPGYPPKFRGGHIDSNRPVGLHPTRRDSSGSDASSLRSRGSVTSLPSDVPFRGSQNTSQVTRREKPDKNNQQRPRSLYDSSSEANKEFSSITEPGPLFIASSYDNLGSDDSRDKSPAAPRLMRSKTMHATGRDDVPKFPVTQSSRQQRLARSKTLGERGDRGASSPGFVHHAAPMVRVPREASRASRENPRPSRGESVGAKLTRANTLNDDVSGRPVMLRSQSQTRPGYRDRAEIASHVESYRERANFKPIIPEGSEPTAAPSSSSSSSHVDSFRAAVQRPAESFGVFQPDPTVIATLKAPEGNRTLNTSPTSAFSKARAQDDSGLHLPGHPGFYDTRRGRDLLSPRSSESLSPRVDKFSPRRGDPASLRPEPRDVRGFSPREGSVESTRSSGSTRSSQSSSKGMNLTEFTSRRAKSYRDRPSDRAKTLDIASIDRAGVDSFIATHKPVQKERKPVHKYAEKQNRKPAKERWQAEPIPPWRDASSERKEQEDLAIGLQPRNVQKETDKVPIGLQPLNVSVGNAVLPNDFNPVIKPIEARPDPPFKTDKKLLEVTPDVPIGLQPISNQQDTPKRMTSDFKPVVVPVETKKAKLLPEDVENKHSKKDKENMRIENNKKDKTSSELVKPNEKPANEKVSRDTVKNEAQIALSKAKEAKESKEREVIKNSRVKKALDELDREKEEGKTRRKINIIDRTPTLARKFAPKNETPQQSRRNQPLNQTQSALKHDREKAKVNEKAKPIEKPKQTEAVELARLVPEPVKRKPKDKSSQHTTQSSSEKSKPSETSTQKVVSDSKSTSEKDQQPTQQPAISKSDEKKRSTETISLVKARMSNFRETEKSVGSPRAARRTQVSTSALKLNKQVSDSVLDAPPPTDVKTMLKEQSRLDAMGSPKLARARETIVYNKLEKSQEVTEPPKVELPRKLENPKEEPKTPKTSKKHLGILQNIAPSLKEHSPTHKERSPSIRDAQDIFSSSTDNEFKPRRNFKIPHKRIEKIPEHKVVGAATLTDKLAMFRDEKRKELAVKSPSGRSASLDVTDRRDSTGLSRYARRRPNSGEAIEEAATVGLPDDRHKPSVDDVLAPITDAISSLVDTLPTELPSPLLSPPLLSPPVMTSPPPTMTSPAPIVSSFVRKSPSMSRRTATSPYDNKMSHSASPKAMLSPVFKFPPPSPPGSPLTRIKNRIQKSPSPNAVKSPAGRIHANTASVGQLKSPPPVAATTNTLGVVPMSKLKPKKDKEDSSMPPDVFSRSHPLPSSQADAPSTTAASVTKLTLSAVKDATKPRHSTSVIKVKSRRSGSQSDSQTGPLSPSSAPYHSGDYHSLEALATTTVSLQLPDIVKTVDAKVDKDSGNISVAMEALDSAIALLSSVSLETSKAAPMERVASKPRSHLATTAAVCDAQRISLREPLTVQVSSATVREAPSDILLKKDSNVGNGLPDLTRNGARAKTTVVLATSTVMTPLKTNLAMTTRMQDLPPPIASGNSVLNNNSISSFKLDNYPASVTQPVATVPPVARYRDVTRTTDSGMYKTITTPREYPAPPGGRKPILSDDSDSILSSDEESGHRSSSSISSEPPAAETPEQRRQRLIRSDSFNRPDSPEVEPLPLPKDSVIVRSRLRRMDSSSSSDSCATPPRSPRVSPRMPRKPRGLRQLLESANLRGFAPEGPSSRATLGVPKAAMWRRRRSKARVFAVPQITTMMRKRRSRSRSRSRSRKAPSHHGSYQDFSKAFQKQVALHRPPAEGSTSRPGRSRTRTPPTQVVTPLEEPMPTPWTVPWAKRKNKVERTRRQEVTRARRVRDKVTSSAVRGNTARSRSKSISSTRRKKMVGDVDISHPHHGTVKNKLTTAMLSRSLRRRKDDPYIT